MQSENKKLIMVSIIAFVIGFLVAWLIWGNSNPSEQAPADTTNNNVEDSSDNNALDSSNQALPQASVTSSLSVQDQAPGKTVNVASASLDGAAWIVVREMIDGEPGNILGAKYVETSGTNLSVELLRGTVEGGQYQALLFRDNGDRQFDHEVDIPLPETTVQFMTSVVPTE